MINKTKSPLWVSLVRKIVASLVIALLSTTIFFCSQEKSAKKITIQGTWIYQSQIPISANTSMDGQFTFKEIQLFVHNNKDSLKSIKAKQAYRTLDDNKWYFETGQVSSYNMYGEGKTETFDKLEVVVLLPVL